MKEPLKVMTETWEVFNRCRQKGIKLNSEKMQVRQKQFSSMGHIHSSEGRGADPNKLKAINKMPSPTDRADVQRTVLKLQNIDASHDPHMSLLNFRNTPEGMDGTPAQRLFLRRTRTSLPMASHLLQPKIISDVKFKLKQRNLEQSIYEDRGTK